MTALCATQTGTTRTHKIIYSLCVCVCAPQLSWSVVTVEGLCSPLVWRYWRQHPREVSPDLPDTPTLPLEIPCSWRYPAPGEIPSCRLTVGSLFSRSRTLTLREHGF